MKTRFLLLLLILWSLTPLIRATGQRVERGDCRDLAVSSGQPAVQSIGRIAELLAFHPPRRDGCLGRHLGVCSFLVGLLQGLVVIVDETQPRARLRGADDRSMKKN